MPNPPKPIEVKRRTGNPGKRPLAKSSTLAAVSPIPPKAYELSLSEALDHVLDLGSVWLGETDMPTVVLLRETVEDYVEMRANPRTTPNQMREVREQISALLSKLGFDPTSRGRLGLAEVKAKSTLEKIRAKRNT